jgi:hypothetical protein
MLAGAPTAALSADLSGNWIVKGEFGPKLRYTLLCVFTVDGSRLAGPCAAAQGAVLRARGVLTGDRLRFNYETEWNESGLELDYAGRLQSDNFVKGVVQNRLAQGVFQGAALTAGGADSPRAWSFDVLFPDVRYSVVCGFQMRGADLAGPCVVLQDAVFQAQGTDGTDQITFGYDTTFQGQAVHVAYAGTTQPDGSLRGTITAGGTTGVFTATRK